MDSRVKVEHLFHRTRLPEGLALFFLPFYVPLGIVVTVIRFFFALQLYILLSIIPKTWLIRRILLRISGSLIGMFVTQQDIELSYQQKYKMIISNHITHLDSLTFESLLPCVMNKQKADQLPRLVQYIMKYDDLQSKIKLPILAFPEESSTNGTKGLLKFSSLPFGVKNEPFLLALLTVSRPYFVQIAPSVLGSSWWSDMFWILFSPYTHFRIRFVKPPEREEQQTNEEYSVVVQKFMATKLGLAATKFDVKEKVEYTKRLYHETVVREASKVTKRGPKAVGEPSNEACCSQESMAKKVKDVLPQVPLKVIQNDLKKTNCIDTTLSNILEGKVQYIVEESEGNKPKSKPETSSNLAKVAANSFGKSSTERHLSFQERKAAFLEAARQKYIAKHNLQVT